MRVSKVTNVRLGCVFGDQHQSAFKTLCQGGTKMNNCTTWFVWHSLPAVLTKDRLHEAHSCRHQEDCICKLVHAIHDAGEQNNLCITRL